MIAEWLAGDTRAFWSSDSVMFTSLAVAAFLVVSVVATWAGKDEAKKS